MSRPLLGRNLNLLLFVLVCLGLFLVALWLTTDAVPQLFRKLYSNLTDVAFWNSWLKWAWAGSTSWILSVWASFVSWLRRDVLGTISHFWHEQFVPFCRQLVEESRRGWEEGRDK